VQLSFTIDPPGEDFDTIYRIISRQKKQKLVGGFNPSEKYESQLG